MKSKTVLTSLYFPTIRLMLCIALRAGDVLMVRKSLMELRNIHFWRSLQQRSLGAGAGAALARAGRGVACPRADAGGLLP